MDDEIPGQLVSVGDYKVKIHTTAAQTRNKSIANEGVSRELISTSSNVNFEKKIGSAEFCCYGNREERGEKCTDFGIELKSLGLESQYFAATFAKSVLRFFELPWKACSHCMLGIRECKGYWGGNME